MRIVQKVRIAESLKLVIFKEISFKNILSPELLTSKDFLQIIENLLEQHCNKNKRLFTIDVLM